MTRSGPLASRTAGAGKPCVTTCRSRCDLGRGVRTGAVAAQDVQVVEGEHVGGRTGGEERTGFGGGGEGLVDGRERLVDGHRRPAVGLGGEIVTGTTQRSPPPCVQKAWWGRSEQVQRCSWIDGRRIRPGCPLPATRKSLTCALPQGHLSGSADQGRAIRSSIRSACSWVLGSGSIQTRTGCRVDARTSEQLAAAGDLPVQRVERRVRVLVGAGEHGEDAATQRRHGVPVAVGDRHRRADRGGPGGRVNGSTAPVATSISTRWCPSVAAVRERWVGSAASR